MDNKTKPGEYAHKPLAVATEGDFAALENHPAEDEKLLDELGMFAESRRQFLIQTAVAGVGVLSLHALTEQYAFGAPPEGYAGCISCSCGRPIRASHG